MAGSPAAALVLLVGALLTSSASEQHKCTLDGSSCTVTCAACGTCTAPSYTYDLSDYTTPAKGWLEVAGTSAEANGTSAARFYYAVCPSSTTGEWLDPANIRCGSSPPPSTPLEIPLPWHQGARRWVGVVAEGNDNGTNACESSPCTLAPPSCANLGCANLDHDHGGDGDGSGACTANGTAGLTCFYGGTAAG